MSLYYIAIKILNNNNFFIFSPLTIGIYNYKNKYISKNKIYVIMVVKNLLFYYIKKNNNIKDKIPLYIYIIKP